MMDGKVVYSEHERYYANRLKFQGEIENKQG